MTHTAADIIALVRATNSSEFALSGSEAELLVNLFASAAASEASLKATKEAWDKAIASISVPA